MRERFSTRNPEAENIIPPVETDLAAYNVYTLPQNNIIEENGYGVRANITAGSSAKGDDPSKDDELDQFLLLDLSQAPIDHDGKKRFRGYGIDPSVDFLLVNDKLDMSRKIGYKGLRKGEEFTIGRNDEDTESRFGELSKTSSREHFSVYVDPDGLAHIVDLGSSNGTHVKSAEDLTLQDANRETPNNNSDHEQNDEKTPEHIWEDEKKKLEDLSNSSEVIKAIQRIEGEYRSIIPADIAFGVAGKYCGMIKLGKPTQAAKIELLKIWHPDKFAGAPDDQKILAKHVAQMIQVL